MAFWHMEESFCGISLKRGTIVIGWIYFVMCAIAFGGTLLGTLPFFITEAFFDVSKTPSNKFRPEVENLPPDETIFNFQDGPGAVDIRASGASDDSPNEDWAMSLPELYGISPETPDYDFLNDPGLTTDHPDNASRAKKSKAVLNEVLIAAVVALMILAVAAAFNGMLLVGAYRDRTGLIGCWIIEQIILVVFFVCYLGAMIYNDALPLFIILSALDLVTRIYCLLVVNSHHHNLKLMQRNNV